MTAHSAAQDHYISHFADNEAELAGDSPAWLAPVRRAAIEHFAILGFPTRKNEAWKYTNVSPILKASFNPSPSGAESVRREDLRALLLDDVIEHSIVFVDGRFAPELSACDALPEGIELRSITEAWANREEQLRPLFEGPDPLDRPFAALNSAFQRDGAFLRARAGTVSEQPIQLLFVTSPGATGFVTSPHNVIQIEDNAKAIVTVRYASLADNTYWTNTRTQIAMGSNSELDLVTIQTEADAAMHLSSLDIQQERDSRFRSHLFSLGGALARNEIHARLGGTGADCVLNGVFLVDGEQHVDNPTTIDHAEPHGSSRELYKGILGGRARGVFNGIVLVRPGAQHTNAQQSNPNLLLSDHAQINTKPTLEIQADDVKCAHGATVGRLDEERLFYLRARGIDEKAARQMLTLAFASDVPQGIPHASVRAQVKDLITQKLACSLTQSEPI
jgi:Fe-S cluster assembly protein SufD